MDAVGRSSFCITPVSNATGEIMAFQFSFDGLRGLFGLVALILLTIPASSFTAQSQSACGADDWSGTFLRPGQISPYALAVGNGNLYVGGRVLLSDTDGDQVELHGVFTWDGTQWHYPAPENGLDAGFGASAIHDMVVVGTDVYVGGSFTQTLGGDTTIKYIARWDGSAWHPLGGDRLDGEVAAVATDGNGNVYAGGAFDYIGDTIYNHIALWNGFSWLPLEHAPGPARGVNNRVNDILIGSGGIIVGGQFTQAGGINAEYLASWNWTTEEWSELGGGINYHVNDLAVYGDDVYIAGNFVTVDDTLGAKYIARWDGSQWHSMASDSFYTIWEVVATPNGEIYATGDFGFSPPDGMKYIAHWTGAVWEPLLPECNLSNQVTTLVADGSELYTIGSQTFCGAYRGNILHFDGTGWHGLAEGFYSSTTDVYDLDWEGDSLLVAGRFGQAGGDAYHGSVAIRSNGVWHNLADGDSIGLDWNDYVPPAYAVGLYDGNIYVGGSFERVGSYNAEGIAMWDGFGWSGLGGDGAGVNVGGAVWELVEYAGELYIGGVFGSIQRSDGSTEDASGIVKWDGSDFIPVVVDTYWNGVGGYVYAMEPAADGIYVGGRFATSGVIRSGGIVKWTGSDWDSLGRGLEGPVPPGQAVEAYDIAVAGADIFVAGSFGAVSNFDGSEVTAPNLARWDGSKWHAMGEFNGKVRALYTRGGELYAAGEFTAIGTDSISHVARWDGSQWHPLGQGTKGHEIYTYGTVQTLTSDGQALWLGGRFTHAGGIPSSNIARWTFCTSEPPVIAGGGSGATVNGTVVTLNWRTSTKQSTAASYRIQIGLGSSFDSLIADESGLTETQYTDTLSETSDYSWRVGALDIDGNIGWSPRGEFSTDMATAVGDEPDALPEQFALSQNYPNPFNPLTTIEFALPKRSDVKVSIFNLHGRLVRTFDLGSTGAGEHAIEWDGRTNRGTPVATGVYFYRIEAGEFARTRKMLLLK